MQWFKHDSDAYADSKIKKLIFRYGPIGYAIYFHCIELIAGDVSETNLTFELEHDSEIIADNLKIQGTATQSAIDIVQEIMRYMVSLGLFEDSGDRIFCNKLLKRLDASMTSNSRFRKAIADTKARHDGVMIVSCKNRIEQNRKEEEEKPKKPRAKADKPLRFQADFDEYWNAYPATKNKVSKSTAYKAYIKKRDEGVTKEDLLAALEIYKQECKGFSDSKYIRCPHRTIEQYTPPIQPKKEEEPVLKRFEHHVMAQIRKRDDGEPFDSALIDLYMDRDSDEAMEPYAKKWAETGDWK